MKSLAQNKLSPESSKQTLSVNRSKSSFFSPLIQPKLTIGSPNDIYEREADAVADKVMRMSDSSQQPVMSQTAGMISRKCAACEEEEKHLQKKGAGDMAGEAAPGIVNDVINSGGGNSLDTSTRNFMESRFGHNFADVRVHTGSQAAESASAIQAKAYTSGNHVVFNNGEYAPHTNEGKYLLAHELTHVVQQGASQRKIQRSCGAREIGSPAGCIGNSMPVPERPRYLFDVSCDNFATGNELDLRVDAESILPNELVEIHGLASEEGDIDFNLNLSCARALRAQEVIQDVLNRRGVTARLAVFSHGPIEGGRSINRSVAIVRPHAPEPEPGTEPEPSPSLCLFMNYSDGHDETNDSDHDLDKAHHSGERTSIIVAYDYVGGETGALIDYNVGFFTGTSGYATEDDNALYNHFISGDGSRMNFDPNTDMSAIVGRESAFISFADSFESAILAYIDAHGGSLCGFDGDSYINSNEPGYLNDQYFVWAVLGGYVRLEASVVQTPTGISVVYRIFDHYGAGVSDAGRWELLGLPALYYLQHFHGSWGSEYTPYIWSVEIARDMDRPVLYTPAMPDIQ
ncbi:DUF4157 domain-containing protein [Dyadobacter sp. NIV53]|uniref:eCIS core domain-containing protein n=1 Tax=Dyadobacter sp. NIV53 TaxID=2861765 RepID=UPI001C88BA73|nr:DUF4157 domain-containing protein [Dyadobacter sp. NIV53]